MRPHSSAISTGAIYTNGPVQLGIAYELHDRIRGTPTDPLSDRAFSVAGAYQFSVVRIGAVYERLNYDATQTTHLKRNLFGVSTTIDIGPGLFYAYVGRAGNGTGSAADGTRIGGLTKGVNSGSTQWEASYTLSAVGAHAGVRRLREDPERIQRGVHVQPRSLSHPVQRLSQRELAASRAASFSGWRIFSSVPRRATEDGMSGPCA